MPDRLAQRVLLVAWPAADWSRVSRLIDAGALPNAKRLVEGGVLARMPGLFPEVEPLVYTSIATGVTADRHGILSANQCDARTGELCAPLSTSRKTKALWNILGEAGMRSLVVNWPAQFPAEAIEGVSAAGDLFVVNSLQPVRAAPPESVFPSEFGPTLAELCLHPSELCREDLLPFFPRLVEIDRRQDRRIEMPAQSVAQAVSVHAITTWLMERERWQFAAVSYGLIEAACGRPGVLDAAYRVSDMMLGRLMALAGRETAILLVSANGFRAREQDRPELERLLPWYGTGGFCCIGGEGAKRERLLHGGSLLDIAPTVLAILGVPVGRDMQGRPLLRAFFDPPVPGFISSWEAQAIEREAEAHAPAEELTALGYRDPAAERVRENTAAVEWERALNRAAVYLDTARPQHAIPVLRELLRIKPDDETCGIALAYAYIVAAEWGQLRELLAELPDNNRTAPLLTVMRAMLPAAGGNVAEALALLKEAELAAGDFPMLAYGIGCVYLRLGKWRRAERAFRAAAERNPEFWLARQAQAVALVRMGKRRDAAALLRESIHTNFAGSASHYLLGGDAGGFRGPYAGAAGFSEFAGAGAGGGVGKRLVRVKLTAR